MNPPSPLAFRFWHATHKLYLPSYLCAVAGTGRILLYVSSRYDREGYWASELLGDTPVSPEQWTGLTDSAGIAIYENDIVRVNGRLSVIQRRAGHWAASWLDYHLGTCAFLGGEPVVLGNANQHPDLLAQALAP